MALDTLAQDGRFPCALKRDMPRLVGENPNMPMYVLCCHRSAGGIQGIPFLGDIPINYWGDSPTLAFTMLVAMGFAETARYMVRGGMGGGEVGKCGFK